MGLGRCRVCGSGQVWRSSVWRYHLLRTLVDSSRRYCGACQERWISDEPVRAGPRRKLLLAVSAISAAGLLLGGASIILGRSSRSSRAKILAKGGGGSAGAASKSSAGVGPGAEEETGAAEGGADEAGIARGFGGENKSGWASLMTDAASLAVGQAMGMIKGKSAADGPGSAELEKMDKKALWEKYGHMFGSKDEAKKSYNEYLEKKKQQEAGGEGESASQEGPPPE